MSKFDLLKFTNSSKKVPAQFLGHRPLIAKSKIFSSHVLDFLVVYTLSSLIMIFLKASMSIFIVTKSLRAAWAGSYQTPTMMVAVFGITTLSYFFFSHFFNQGQTWGMKVMKIRYPLKSFDYQGAIITAVSSLSFFLTGGLSMISLQKDMTEHDHLYHELVQPREMNPVNLVKAIEISEEMDRDYKKAA